MAFYPMSIQSSYISLTFVMFSRYNIKVEIMKWVKRLFDRIGSSNSMIWGYVMLHE